MKRLVKFFSVVLSLTLLITCVSACHIKNAKLDEVVRENMRKAGYEVINNDGSFTGETVEWEVSPNPEGLPVAAVNALRDDKFQAGINLMGTNPGTENRDVKGYLDYMGNALVVGNDTGLSRKETHNRQRAWEITQWTRKENLANRDSTTDVYDQTTGDYIYKNAYKTVTVNPTKGSATLAANCGLEYGNTARTVDGWVHLLLEQYPTRYYMSEVKSVNAYIDFTLNKIENKHLDGSFNPGAHAAQLVWYFILCSKKGGTLWFGIPLYDNRSDNQRGEGSGYPGGEAFAFDKGTNMVIYSVDPYYYLGRTGAHVGVNNKCVIPLESSIKFCVEESVKVGTLAAGTTVDDCWLDSMNIGWEIPGTFDVSVTFNHIGLYVETK